MSEIRNICIFASSSARLEKQYYELAQSLGEEIAKIGAGLIFGGGREGLMGAAARGAISRGGRVTGVIPRLLNQPGIAYPDLSELHETETMHARKQMMEDLSDAFIALPGGFGTLEEVLEVITLRQLGYHDKPVVLLNAGGFFEPLLEQFERLYAEAFAHTAFRSLYAVANTPEEAVRLARIQSPEARPDKLSMQRTEDAV